MTKVSVVILNWNGREFLERFLPSVTENTAGTGREVIVADNASTDDSVEYLRKNFPGVRLILLDRNYGFAEGYNRALMQLESEYFLLLNSDVEVTPGWLDPLLNELESNPLIAGCAPKLLDYGNRDFFEYAGASGGYIDKFGYAFCRGRMFDSVETDYGQYNDLKDVFWVTGACMLVRAELFKLTGGFDAGYFAHFEEIDLCWRLKNRGYRFLIVPESKVFHVGGGTLPASDPWKTYLNYRNNIMTLYKNHDPSGLASAVIKRLMLDGISSLRYLSRFKLRDFLAVFRAHIAFYSRISELKKFRRSEKVFVKSYSHKEIYRGIAVRDYFIKNRKSFNSLNWKLK